MFPLFRYFLIAKTIFKRKIFSYIFFLSSWWSLDGTELNTRSKKLKLRPQRSPSRTILTFLTDSKCLDSYMSRCCSCRFSKDRSKVAKTLKFGEKKLRLPGWSWPPPCLRAKNFFCVHVVMTQTDGKWSRREFRRKMISSKFSMSESWKIFMQSIIEDTYKLVRFSLLNSGKKTFRLTTESDKSLNTFE